MDSRNDKPTPDQEEEVFESPQSDEEMEEADVAKALRRHPWHEENPKTLLIFAATLKQLSIETPATERPNFVQLAVGASNTLEACKSNRYMRSMSFADGEWAGYPLAQCSLSQCARHTHVKRGGRGIPLPKKMRFSTGVKEHLQATSVVAKARTGPPRDKQWLGRATCQACLGERALLRTATRSLLQTGSCIR